MQIIPTTSRRRQPETGAKIKNSDLSDVFPSPLYDNGFFGVFNRLFHRFILRTRRKLILCVVVLFLLSCSSYLLYEFVTEEMGGHNDEITSAKTVSSFVEPAPVADQRKFSNNEREDDVDDFFAMYEPEKHAIDAVNRRLEELNRVRVSLLNDLRLLEEKRNHLRTEIDTMTIQSERLQAELRQGVKELDQIRISIDQAKIIQRETAERNTPEIALPQPLLPRPFSTSHATNFVPESKLCTMSNCFDYSRCSITNGFPIYVYGNGRTTSSDVFDDDLIRVFARTPYLVNDPKLACVFVLPLKRGVTLTDEVIKELPYWRATGDGANHLIINAASSSNFGHSIILADQVFSGENSSFHFRFGFDILSPRPRLDLPDKEEDDKEILNRAPLIPARRRYFLSVLDCSHFVNSRNGDEEFLRKQLLQMQRSKTDDLVYFHSSCQPTPSSDHVDAEEVGTILDQSTFALFLNLDDHGQSTFLRSFTDSLKRGAVPVVLTSSSRPLAHFLPFGETLDWPAASIQLPLARLPELHYYLRTLTDADVVSLRRQGRLLYQSYFSSKNRLVESILATLRYRLNLPAVPAEDVAMPSFYNESYQPKFGDGIKPSDAMVPDMDEYLGPIELPYPSPRFQQNFTLSSTFTYKLWNVYADPFRLYPQFPFAKDALPPEAKFLGSPYGFRPINDGAGGSGKEFSESLGGNFPREQFTVVMLTYEREQVLVAALSRLNNLPYLNKIIVVWNGPTAPDPNMVWPRLTAPIMVLKPERNSLNNRFLPFREIETEAVLSIDDDVHLRRDEIIFGFRAWREARERIVGFPARYHAWDSSAKQWAYNSNHSCELSMVLTGAAFIHKYYFYLYTHWMPSAIRRKVDELMNCEDLAMNFLVSYVTKEAPIKATSRWTFRCPGCPETLSADESHFLERHDCLNYFSRVYGYTPLLYTQFRVDSILFKMRIPHTHQKCFKYI